MRKNLPLLIAMGLIVFTSWAFGRHSTGDDSAPSGGYARIATIEVAKIFKEFSSFKEQIEALKIAASEEEKNIRKEKSLIDASEEKLKKTVEGTTEYRDLEKSIAQSKMELAETIKGKRGYLMNREADIYRSAYRDIVREVQAYAREKKIDLVLRFQSEKMEHNNTPEEIANYVNRLIIWRNKELDITEEIQERLKNRAERNESDKENGDSSR